MADTTTEDTTTSTTTDASTSTNNTTTGTVSPIQQIFNDLMSLSKQNLGLYYTDETTGMGEIVRTFSYKTGVTQDTWGKSSALNCSGIMFTLNSDGTMKDVICRPMEKFFDYMENSFTQYLDLAKATVTATVKQDGVSVSSYMSGGYLYLKTKSSIYTNISVLAMQTLNKPEYNDLRAKIQELESEGYTVNLEYVSPQNRVVLYYEVPSLIVINARDRETGEYISFDTLYGDATIRKYMTDGSKVTNVPEWIDNVLLLQNTEGYVCEMDDGLRFKVKTNWYNALMDTRNSITDDQTLYRAIAMGGYQDIINLVNGYDYAVEKTNAFEEKFLSVIQGATQAFLNTYKQVNGKEYSDYVTSSKTILNSTDYSWIWSLVVNNYNKPIAYDMIVSNISNLFITNYKLFIPSGYSAPIESVPRGDG